MYACIYSYYIYDYVQVQVNDIGSHDFRNNYRLMDIKIKK